MANNKKKKQNQNEPSLLETAVQGLEDFLDWIAPMAEWVGDKAEQIKAASDAVPPPSRKWVRNRRIDTRNATVTIFMLFLAVVTVLSLNLSLRPTYSELEQRELTKFPKPTFMEVLDGTFFNEVNTWFADTFPFREKFLSVHSTMEGFYGFRGKSVEGEVVIGDVIPDTNDPIITPPVTEPDTSTVDTGEAPADTSADTSEPAPTEPTQSVTEPENHPQDIDDGQSDDYSDAETLGALYTNKNTAYEYYHFVRETADEYISMVNRAAEMLKGKAKVYDMVVPTSMHICVPEKVRKGLQTSDQAEAISYLYRNMSPDVTTVNILDTLTAHQQQKEYLYYRTDHHWSALGAYYAYREFAPLAGRPAVSLDGYEERIYDGFLGSFYRELNQNKAMAKKPDTVYAYVPKATNTMKITDSSGNTNEYPIVADGTNISQNYKYLCFIGGDNPWSVIENPDLNDGSSILLVKESFGNCFAPFLVESYQYVYVVDYRHIRDIDSSTLADLVEQNNIKDVLFLNNISATRENSLVKQMVRLVG